MSGNLIELQEGTVVDVYNEANYRETMRQLYFRGLDLATRLGQQDDQVLRLSVALVEPDLTVKQRGFYRAAVLPAIAAQASTGEDRQHWSADAWHQLFKREFLGYRIEKITVAGRRRKVVRKVLRSTEDLSVRAYSKYLDRVIAFAVTDLSVHFELTDWRQYQEAVERERHGRA